MFDSLQTSSDVLAVVVHLAFILLTLVLLLICCLRKTRTRCLFIRFYGHIATWAMTMVAMVILLFVLLEGVLTDVQSSAFHLIVHLCNVSALFAAGFVLLLYNHAENARCLSYLILICIYWFLAAAVRAVHLATLVGDDDHRARGSARFYLVCLVVFFYVILGISTIVVLIKQKLRRLHPTRMLSIGSSEVKEDDLTSVLYIHTYVCLLSKILLHWFNGILFTGYKKILATADLGKIPLMDSSQVNYEKLKALFEEEKRLSYVNNRSPSLLRCFWRMTRRMMLLSGLFKLISDCLLYVPPICLDFIVNYLMRIEKSQSSVGMNLNDTPIITTEEASLTQQSLVGVREFFSNGYVLSVICFLILVIQMTLFQQHLFISIRQGIRCKCAVQALVFDKSLRLYVSTINEGRLMNHMTVDPLHIVMLFTFVHSIWTMPIQILIGLVMLYIQLGTSALISGIVILLMVVVQYSVAQRLGVTQDKIMEQSDQRLKQSNEMLQSIKLLKLYAWERVFYESVVETRAKELRLMLTASILRTLSISVTDGVPYFACFLTFTLYHYLESEPLNAGKVFSGLALFSLFGSQLFIITLMINVASQARISVSRLCAFLLLTEVEMQPVLQQHPQQQPQAYGDVLEPLLSSDGDVAFSSASNDETASVPLQMISSQPAAAALPTDDDDSKLIQLDVRLPLTGSAIEIVDGNFCATDSDQILFDINLKIPAGKLTMVIGSVGGGKSSLLWAILGELKLLSGSITYGSRSFAFVPQSSVIMNSTVRENITFGLPFDEVKYEKVIKVSGLQPDIATFPGGDQAEIGEKGANLSGGQRQRVSIARALYSDADIYLMDDPLSALDALVGGQIFEEAIIRTLIGQQKTVILVTHHVHLLPRANHLILMKGGRVLYEGHPDGFLSDGSPLPLDIQIDPAEARIAEKKDGRNSLLPGDSDAFSLLKRRMSAGVKGALSYTTLSMLSDDVEFSDTVGAEKLKIDGQQPSRDLAVDEEIGRLIEKEELSFGAVPYRYFIAYFRAATWLLTTLAISLYGARMAGRMSSDFWLTKLIDASIHEKMERHESNESRTEDIQPPSHGMTYYIVIYFILSMLAIASVPFGTMFLELMALTASRNLHHRMLHSVILAPLRFFDTNPIGRIVNRLSADMNVIDEKLTPIYDALLFCTLSVLGGVIMNSVFVPWFLIPVLPILVIFVAIQRFCITSCRELQRLDCNTKSPILAHFSQVLTGLSTVRAYKCEQRFQLENFEKIDNNNVVFLFFNTCHTWLGLRLDYLGSLLVLAACLSAITSCLMGAINSAEVGLVVSYAIMISSLLNWTMRNVTEMEVYFGSVERVIQYGSIESEPYEESKGPLPPDEWPSEGEIRFQNVSLQYSQELDRVVRNFSLLIKSGKKVGICGRTGSGKSSLTLSMFRMVIISEGQILLDGIDICNVPLQLLRSRLSIIPQDPVLFSGTVRFNLDPLKKKTDPEIWEVLKISQLLDLVSKLPQQLDTPVSEGGDNMSVGQRQLFCLARALLRNSKVLIMDEATASVDPETDKLIQKIVKTAFVHCTVVTIAHRLSTITSCDLVIVLKDGQKIEEGRPGDLIARGGAFAQMLAENQL